MITVVTAALLIEDVPTVDGRIIASGAVPVPVVPAPLLAREVGPSLTAVGMLDRFEWRDGRLHAWGTLADRLGPRLPLGLGAALSSSGSFERTDAGLVCREGVLRHVVIHLDPTSGPAWSEAVLTREEADRG